MSGEKLVINIVDQLSTVNFGIWHAAIATAEALKRDHNVRSILLAPESDFEIEPEKFPFVEVIRLAGVGKRDAEFFLKGFDSSKTTIATHGAWQFPTKWGSWAKSLGFDWIYTPHGMLEPWSMQQKPLKKWLYFNLFELKMARKANFVRAVGKPEGENLAKIFPRVHLIPNGVYSADIMDVDKPDSPIQVLYLARLHHKKGVIPLVESWKA